MRALEACFGNVIGNAHDIKSDGGHIGKEVFWSLGELGLVLEAFTPVEDASEELLDLYEKTLEDEEED